MKIVDIFKGFSLTNNKIYSLDITEIKYSKRFNY